MNSVVCVAIKPLGSGKKRILAGLGAVDKEQKSSAQNACNTLSYRGTNDNQGKNANSLRFCHRLAKLSKPYTKEQFLRGERNSKEQKVPLLRISQGDSFLNHPLIYIAA